MALADIQLVLAAEGLEPRVKLLLLLDGFLREIPQLTVAGARRRVRFFNRLLAGSTTRQPVLRRHERFRTAAGDFPCRWYDPQGEGRDHGVLLYLHGGGYVVGDLDSHDTICAELASEAHIKVLALDYPLAPESPFPAPRDAVWEAFQALRQQMPPSALIVVGGDSAGGQLAAQISKLAVESGVRGPDLQLLIYPLICQNHTSSSFQQFKRGFLLTEAMIHWFQGYHRGRPEPDLTELLAGMPPALIYSAAFDPLRDEALSYHDRLVQAGVNSRYHCFAGLVHGFGHFIGVVPAALMALRRIGRELGDTLDLLGV